MHRLIWTITVAGIAATAVPSIAVAQSTPTPSSGNPPPEITQEVIDEARRNYQQITQVEGFDKFATDSDGKAIRGLIPYRYRGAGEQAEAFFVADTFARCAVKLSEKRARNLLNLSMDGGIHIEQEQAYYDRLKGCAIRRAAIDREFMRGSLAVHILLNHEEIGSVEPALTQVELLDFLRAVEVVDGNFTQNLTSTQLGFQCRAALAPDLAHGILAKEPGSDSEANAIIEIEEKTSYCNSLFENDKPTNWFARVFLARGLYHWGEFRKEYPAETSG